MVLFRYFTCPAKIHKLFSRGRYIFDAPAVILTQGRIHVWVEDSTAVWQFLLKIHKYMHHLFSTSTAGGKFCYTIIDGPISFGAAKGMVQRVAGFNDYDILLIDLI